MKPVIFAALLSCSLLPTAQAQDIVDCQIKQYDTYIDASLQWYQDLTQLTVTDYPDLKEVADWFLEGRKHHFELSRAVVHDYLRTEPNKVATNRSIEAWLQLEQTDVKALTKRNDELGKLAKETFHDRQTKPHEKNYELRSAFAELLSHPQKIDTALSKYNAQIEQIEQNSCQ